MRRTVVVASGRFAAEQARQCVRQGIEGEADKHHAAELGDQDFMALIQRAHPLGTHHADQDRVGQQATDKAQQNQRRQHRQCKF